VQIPLLFLTVFVIATCGLGYELIAGTVASYLLGDSVTQFSTAIGLYLFALGIGAYLSRYLETKLCEHFVDIELAVALLGGYAAAILMVTFAHAAWFRPILYGTILATGTLVGLEVPLLLRILKSRMEFKELVAKVLTVDYVGSLAASLLFPLLLVPRLGLMRTSLAFGLANALVALWSTFLLREGIPRPAGLRFRCGVVLLLLTGGFVFGDRLTSLAEDGLYSDEVIAAKTSPYQRIVVTKGRGSFQLFLNGNLQFSSADEYRYHEALVHPAALAATSSLGRPPRRVLVLGGGDGLAARELLRYPSVEQIVLVDLDRVMTELAATLPLLKEQNGGSLRSPKVTVINDDAMHWLDQVPSSEPFDLAIVDFPDPSSFAVGKLYTTHLYKRLRSRLADHGAVAVQSTSPLFARRSYWCIMQTLAAAGFRVHPYHAFVPSFGEWGYALALPALRGSMQTENQAPVFAAEALPEGLRYVGASSLASLFVLSPDMGPLPVAINRLNNQALVAYYEQEWRRWN
jgi:spermidine synthase